jgi:uncharacterized protein DUF669
MKFTPTTEEQQERRTFEPFPAGEYDFTVEAAEEQTSRNNNEMVKLTLHVYNTEGHKRVVFDYMLDSAAWKIKQFAASAGLLERYDSGEIEAYEMVGKTGRLKLKIESSEQYGDQNKVAFYIAAKSAGTGYTGRSAPASVSRHTTTSIDDDAVPF